MRPVERLPPQDWLACPETLRLVAALGGDGTPVRFVGGAVRDALLARPVKDLDLATPLPPDEVLRRLAAAGLKGVPTGLAHGTVTAVVAGRPYEVTTLRRDVETFGRHARVDFTDDWAADAARRDFTMNALYCDPDGTLYDPTGGLPDLRAGRVRFVGPPADRIAEDYLRILRFFRLHAWYGRAAPDRPALAACRAAAPGLDRLSGERIRHELLRLLAAPAPRPTLAVMRRNGILDRILGPLRPPARLGRLLRAEAVLGEADPVRRLAALLDGDRAAAARAVERLRPSRADAERLLRLVDDRPAVRSGAPALRRLVYREGPERAADIALLAGRPQAAAACRALPVPRLPIAGRDALALGVPPGPAVGRLLAEVEHWWRGRDFVPDRAACLGRLRRAVLR